MLKEFSEYYLKKAKYELIDDGKTYYGEIPQLRGVWAVGKDLEECRKNLVDTMEGWLVLRLKKNLSVPNFKVPFRKMPIGRAYAET